jgi:hypothetical protein
MIKVVCIHPGNLCLTKNKIYDVEIIMPFDVNVRTTYRLENDLGDMWEYNTYRFISIAKWREQQIKSILDD